MWVAARLTGPWGLAPEPEPLPPQPLARTTIGWVDLWVVAWLRGSSLHWASRCWMYKTSCSVARVWPFCPSVRSWKEKGQHHGESMLKH